MRYLGVVEAARSSRVAPTSKYKDSRNGVLGLYRFDGKIDGSKLILPPLKQKIVKEKDGAQF